MKKLAIWTMGEERYNREVKGDVKIRRQGIIRSIIDLLVSDLIDNTAGRLESRRDNDV